MATPVAETSARNDMELPPAVHWPAVYGTAAVGGLAFVLLCVAAIGAGRSPPPEPAAPDEPVAVVVPPPARHTAPAVKPAALREIRSADPAPQPVASRSAPAPIAAVRPAIRPPELGVPVPGAAMRPTPPASPPSYDAASQPLEPPPSANYDSGAPPTAHDFELLEDLKKQAVEIDLNAVEGTSAKLLQAAARTRQADGRKIQDAGPATIRELVAVRADLVGRQSSIDE